ncbi:MAG: Kae1-associated kinase Bud32 [Candidatus Altiarchaeales archaeon]|nr:MAG: Kae1-associated kinase Bud32 [Candidatus Altiarchaeales archaeon]
MVMELIAKGAEASLYLEGNRLIKHRIKKGYRIREIDTKLRKSRTQREAKLLENSRRKGISVPRVYKVDLDEKKIVMEFIDGKLIKDLIPSLPDSEIERIAEKMGETIAKLHGVNIIHNDLTTSNMILKNNEVFLIDFGLGVTSTRIEDKAMDMVVLKKSLSAAHIDKFDLIWDSLLRGYRSLGEYEEILERIATIVKRARYT